MNYTHLLPFSYTVPTFLPTPPGRVVAAGDAPTIHIDDPDLEARAQRLVNVLYWTATTFADVPGMRDSQTLKTFIAPEFYFRKSSELGGRIADFRTSISFGSYPESVRYQLADQLYGAIHGSDVFMDWTIVGGTVCSALPVDEGGRLNLLNTAMMFRGRRAAADESVPYVLMEKHYISNIDGPPAALHANLDPTTAYSFALNPDQELDNLIYWDRMRVGLEVCLDHRQQVLVNALRRLECALGPGQERLDLQLVTSCGMSIVAPAAAVKDGAIVHLADGISDRPTLTAPIHQVGRYRAATGLVEPFPADAFDFRSLPPEENYCVDYADGDYAAIGSRQGVSVLTKSVPLVDRSAHGQRPGQSHHVHI